MVFKTCRVNQKVLFLGENDHSHQIKSHFEGGNLLDFPLAERPGITAILGKSLFSVVPECLYKKHKKGCKSKNSGKNCSSYAKMLRKASEQHIHYKKPANQSYFSILFLGIC